MVVIGVVAVLTALILPAVQSAREASRRAQCSQRLVSLGLAFHQYADQQGTLPMGRFVCYDPRYVAPVHSPGFYLEKSCVLVLLPYLEESSLYEALNHAVTVQGFENSTLFGRTVSSFLCPSDSEPITDFAPTRLYPPPILDPPFRIALASYSGCFGTFPINGFPQFFPPNYVVPSAAQGQQNGAFSDLRGHRLSEFSDGLSKTILASEKSAYRVAMISNSQGMNAGHGWYLIGNLGDTLFVTMFRPNAIHGKSSRPDASVMGASSEHPQGINVLFADGSVSFVNDSIDCWDPSPIRVEDGVFALMPQSGVWQALGTRAGGEAVNW